MTTTQKQVRNLPLSTDLMYDYKDATDQYLVVADFLADRFDDFPTLTDNPDLHDGLCDIVERRLIEAYKQQAIVNKNKVNIGQAKALNAAIVRRDYFLGV